MKAGIVTENKNVPLFEEALTAAGFHFTKASFGSGPSTWSGASTLTVEYEKAQFHELEELCKKVQLRYFLIADSSHFKKEP